MNISQILGSMLQKTIKIQEMDLPQQTKDNTRNIMTQSLNIVLEQTHPRKINQILIQELRKKHREGDSIE